MNGSSYSTGPQHGNKPQKPPQTPIGEEPMKDKLITETEISFSLIERLCILFGKHLWVKVVTETENTIGKATSRANATLDPWSMFRRKADACETIVAE